MAAVDAFFVGNDLVESGLKKNENCLSEQVPLTKNSAERNSQPKLLVICSTLDLDYPYGATPAIWQLLKGLFEIGLDTIVIPYRGKSIRSPWWRCYPNPTEKEGALYAHSGLHVKNASGFRKNINDSVVPKLASIVVQNKWKRVFSKISENEKELAGVLLLGVPLNHFNSLSSFIKSKLSCPLLYYDLDAPTSLPHHGGFSFNYYQNANLAEYDAILVPSEGVCKEIMEMGAQKLFFVHFGVDPELYLPLKTKQDVGAFFFATNDSDREKSVKMMISEPSRTIDAPFLVSGIKYKSSLGRAKKIPMIQFSQWRHYAARSKINLNIPRETHASTYATSTSRPFELAAMGCCIVSAPYSGLEKWFKIGDEIFVANDTKEALELYSWLLNDDEARENASHKAREHVLREHTFKQRAQEITSILKKVSTS